MGSKSNREGSNLSKSALDRQVQGNHYKKLKYQVSEYILGNNLNWIDANIVKYASRNKDGETLEQKYSKIIHYAELGKELLKNKK
jgi:hypothetical protein|tara:strand:+ start:1326 stop:1580 length:255 start_codon:yes stop_codon:yes gene_type:complete